MAQYRKKPIVIQAIQFHAGKMTIDEIRQFVTCDADYLTPGDTDHVVSMTIPTLEGEFEVGDGDWIIKGIKGEFYPCKPDIFERSYELVS